MEIEPSTAAEKRDYIRRISMKGFRTMLPDIGAQRCIAIIESGSDSDIEQAWKSHYKTCWDIDEMHGKHK